MNTNRATVINKQTYVRKATIYLFFDNIQIFFRDNDINVASDSPYQNLCKMSNGLKFLVIKILKIQHKINEVFKYK